MMQSVIGRMRQPVTAVQILKTHTLIKIYPSCMLSKAPTTCMASAAFSSRNRDLKSLQSREFIETELKENPEFFRAFPHLQTILNEKEEDEDDPPPQTNDKYYFGKGSNYEAHKAFTFGGLNEKPGYFGSLLHQQNDMKAKVTDEDSIHNENERNFIEGSLASVEGPFKYLTKERVAQIHLEIDERLQELEESGLTRNEILFDDPNKGIPLRDDPFFQLIKTNRTAREMLIAPTEDFTADRVIEKALRQDIGVDNSLSNA